MAGLAMSITAVRDLLAGISGKQYTLTAATLSTAAITRLFDEFIPGPGLVIDQPEGRPGTLTLAGRTTLTGATPVPVLVTFQADSSGSVLAGITIAFELASFSFTTPWASFSGTALADFGLSAPHLVLAAGAATDDGSPQAAVEGKKSVTTTAGTADATLRAAIAPASLVAQGLASQTCAFSAELTGVTLGNLAALAQFVAGSSFDLPAALPVASAIELTEIGLVFDPAGNRLLSFSATVRSDQGLPLLRGVRVDSFWFSFNVLGLTSPPPQVYAVAGTTLDLYGHHIDLTLSIPDLYFEGDLHQDQPVALKPFIASFSAALADLVPDNFRLARLDFGVSLTPPHGYNLAVEVDELWSVTLGTVAMSVDSVSVWLESDGTGSPAIAIAGRITFAKASLYLSFSRAAQAAGWMVAGGTVDAAAITLPDGSAAGGIDVGALIADLGTHFGVKVPAPIASIAVSELKVSFQTGTGEFVFDCTGRFKVADTPLAITVNVDITPKTGGGFHGFFRGSLTVGPYQFTVIFDHDNTTSDTFVATYAPTCEPGMADLRDLVASLSPAVAELVPHGIEIGLRDVKLLFVRQTSGTPPVPTTQWAVSLDLGTKISLSGIPGIGQLLSEETLAITRLQIGYASPPGLSADQVIKLNVLLDKDPKVAPFVPAGAGVAFGADLMLGAQARHIDLGVAPPAQASPPPAIGPAKAAPPAPAPAAPAPPGPPAAGPPAQADPIKWFDVNRQFGVFSFRRVGAGYRDNILLFALDASVAVGPLAFSVQALTVGSSLKAFDPVFSLDGLALDFNRPPIAIGGAFLRTTQQVGKDTVTAYYGEVMVGVGSFALKAVGGWTPATHSFFLYLSIDVPLGGPPFLFVTGLAGGFGINTHLTLPSVDEAGSYILLPGIAPKEEATPAETIKSLITQLSGNIQPMSGEYWVAAGIAFTSFEMIRSRVVVSVAFGVEVQVGVVGVVTMTFPTGAGDDAVAHVEIDLVASFTPSTGLLAVDGKLSPQSFLFGGFVKLTGGFAFRTWFSGEHHGDFVVSLGGYHPAFSRPDNYPVVPRLGLVFALGPLKVIGESYFALTPHAFMAGIRLSATFEAGPVKVWFDAGIDFLIEWAPFHYEAGAYVDFGCSVDLGLFTLTVHIGADLEIWGPAFGGTALVDLTIISFTIPFGAQREPPPPIGWDTLTTRFLPAPTPARDEHPAAAARAAMANQAHAAPAHAAATSNVVRADVPEGKLKAGVTDADGRKLDWIVDPDHFRIVTTSAVPANHADWTTAKDTFASLPNDLAAYHRGLPAPGAVSAGAENGQVPPDMYLWVETTRPDHGNAWEPALHVAPMRQRNVSSHHVIDLHQVADGGTAYRSNVAVRPVVTASNTALWGELGAAGDKKAQNANAPRLIKNTLTGLEISPVPRHPGQVSAVPLRSLIYQGDLHTEFAYSSPAPDTDYTVTVPQDHPQDSLPIDVSGAATEHLSNDGYLLSSLTDPWVSAQRDGVLGQLRALGFGTLSGRETDLSTLAATRLTDWPAVARIGVQP